MALKKPEAPSRSVLEVFAQLISEGKRYFDFRAVPLICVITRNVNRFGKRLADDLLVFDAFETIHCICTCTV